MPEPITFDALAALGFSVYREKSDDGKGFVTFAMRKVSDYFWLTFYAGVLYLDYDYTACNGHEFPNDMKYVRLAMRLFNIRKPGRRDPSEPPRPGGRPKGEFRTMLEQLEVGGSVTVEKAHYAGKRNTAINVEKELPRKFATRRVSEGYYQITRVE